MREKKSWTDDGDAEGRRRRDGRATRTPERRSETARAWVADGESYDGRATHEATATTKTLDQDPRGKTP